MIALKPCFKVVVEIIENVIVLYIKVNISLYTILLRNTLVKLWPTV